MYPESSQTYHFEFFFAKVVKHFMFYWVLTNVPHRKAVVRVSFFIVHVRVKLGLFKMKQLSFLSIIFVYMLVFLGLCLVTLNT